MLYVPVNVDRFVVGAANVGADAIQLDLEDGVAGSEKDRARTLVQKAASKASRNGADIVVRINRPLSLAIRDIEASVCPLVRALSLPKVEGPGHVRLLSEAVAEAELRAGMVVGSTAFIVGIESPEAWLDMAKIARADDRIAAMLLGGEDFATAIGMTTDPENFLGPKQALVIAAAAAGVMPLGVVGSFANFRDLDAFRTMVRRSRQLGFRGSGCIHPTQVPILNEEFAPSSDELARAREIIERFEASQSEGVGAVSLHGAMVDLPVVDRARALLSSHARIALREGT
jgi:citrate lyase subunit beta/citryl-CoA lyase